MCELIVTLGLILFFLIYVVHYIRLNNDHKQQINWIDSGWKKSEWNRIVIFFAHIESLISARKKMKFVENIHLSWYFFFMQNKFVRDSVTNRKLDEFPNNSISLCSMWPWYEVQWLENWE